MTIKKSEVDAFLARPLDHWVGVKKLTREQLLRELRGLRVPPQFKTEPWLHQLACFYIGVHMPEFLWLLDMGLGKSKIVADLITHAQRTKRLKRALIGVPRLINVDSWEGDLAKHSDLEPWRCGAGEIEEKRERLLNPQGDVTIIDYAGLHLALCDKVMVKGKRGMEYRRNDRAVRQAQKLYNFVDLDESHKLQNHQSLWFGIARQLTKTADFVYANTGTLFGSNIEGAWSQFFLVDRGETFGENLGKFRAAFFHEKVDRWRGITYEFNRQRARNFYRMLQHRSLRYDEAEVPEVDLPPRVMRAEHCEMAPEQREHYLRAVQGVLDAGGKLRELDANWLRMRQIVSGYLEWEDDHGRHLIPFKHNPKLDLLERLMDEVGGRSKVVICHDYTTTGRLITERLKAMGIDYEWLYGGTKDKSASRRRFLEDPGCTAFVMNSEAGGTGNDGLQDVARYLFFYETPTSPITRQQTLKRIHRPGQRNRCFIYDLVMRQSTDRGILDDIAANRDLHDSLVAGRVDRRKFFS